MHILFLETYVGLRIIIIIRVFYSAYAYGSKIDRWVQGCV